MALYSSWTRRSLLTWNSFDILLPYEILAKIFYLYVAQKSNWNARAKKRTLSEKLWPKATLFVLTIKTKTLNFFCEGQTMCRARRTSNWANDLNNENRLQFWHSRSRRFLVCYQPSTAVTVIVGSRLIQEFTTKKHFTPDRRNVCQLCNASGVKPRKLRPWCIAAHLTEEACELNAIDEKVRWPEIKITIRKLSGGSATRTNAPRLGPD